MGQYFNLLNPSNDGKLALSSNVFYTLGDNCLNDIIEDNKYSSQIVKNHDKKESKIKVNINKNTVEILCYIIITKDADLKTLTDAIKNRIYDSVYRATEISNVKINVEVLETI